MEVVEQGLMQGWANELSLMILQNPYVAGSAVVAGLIVLAANAATMFLPTQVKTKKGALLDKVANMGLRFANMLALNILKNKNKDDKK